MLELDRSPCSGGRGTMRATVDTLAYEEAADHGKAIRFSISGINGIHRDRRCVGLVGLREGTEVWASLRFALTAIALLRAVPSLIYSQGAERAGWVGFTLFGWVYLVFMFSTWSGESPGIPSLPASSLLTTVHERIHAQP